MKKIALTGTRGKGLFALVDDEDYERILRVKMAWHWNCGGAASALPLPARGQYLMHRVVMNAQPGQWVDHINGNRLDNRKQNLRFATPTENQRNRKPTHNKAARGVRFNSRDGLWKASIQVDRKEISLGQWSTEAQAQRARACAELFYFAEFARVNDTLAVPKDANTLRKDALTLRPKSKTSRFIGVSRDHNAWRAEVSVKGKRVWGRLFDDEVVAAKARDAAAIQFHGRTTTLNFPEDDDDHDLPLHQSI